MTMRASKADSAEGLAGGRMIRGVRNTSHGLRERMGTPKLPRRGCMRLVVTIGRRWTPPRV